jgi:hypothetical protein
MRWSSANKWSGGLREHYQPIAETDPLALWARRGLLPGFRNVFVMRNSEVILICSGCQEVATQLKARRQDIPDQFLYIDDFRDCLIKVEPHAPHVVDWEEVTNRVLKNTAVGSAWDAYTRYVGMASEYREQYRRKVHDLAYSHEKAVQTLSEDVMFDANIDDQGEATALTTWMLQDAEKRAQEKSR